MINYKTCGICVSHDLVEQADTTEMLVWLLHAGCGALSRPAPRSARLSASGSMVVIDADNVRGKSGFRLSHEGLIARVAQWASGQGMSGRVAIATDHGAYTQGFHLPRLGVGLAFAGPSQTADDLIVRWVEAVAATPETGSAPHLLVVTADSGLALRCRRAAHGRGLSVIKPQLLLDQLADANEVRQARGRALDSCVQCAAEELARSQPDMLQAVASELAARAALLKAERSLTRYGSTKKRKQVVRQVKVRQQELAAVVSRSEEAGAPSFADLVSGPAAAAELPSAEEPHLDDAPTTGGARARVSSRRLGQLQQDAYIQVDPASQNPAWRSIGTP